MKNDSEVFNEVTYVQHSGTQQNEIMVHFNGNGKIIGMYTYRDSIGKRFENWRPGQNPLFIHCPENELHSAITWLKFNAIKCGED